MSNTIKTSAMIARDAAILLEDNLVMANLVNRKHEQVLNAKVGTYVDVVRSPVQTARDFIDDSLTTTAKNRVVVALKNSALSFVNSQGKHLA